MVKTRSICIVNIVREELYDNKKSAIPIFIKQLSKEKEADKKKIIDLLNNAKKDFGK